MTPYSRKYLRQRFLDTQQTQLAEDAKLADPADAYRELLDELTDEQEEEQRADCAA